MTKRSLSSIIVLLFVLCLIVSGCGKSSKSKKKEKEKENGAIDITIQDEECYAIITKGSGNAYNDHIIEGFKTIISDAGKQTFVYQPEKGTAKEQIQVVRELIKNKVSCIAIAPVDADALDSVLQDAIEADIPVISFDTPANPDSRLLDVNESGTEEIAETLIEAVRDVSGGQGYWAIVSSFSTSANQNAWIAAMRELSEDDKYKGLGLVEIAYGDDDYHKSYDQTISLLKKYPDLKVICAPTTIGIQAAAAAVKDTGKPVKVVGLGLPSEMAEYVSKGDICPYIYMWNPNYLGQMTAYVSMAFGNRKITGEEGEQLLVDNNQIYEVRKASDEGTEVIVGNPFRFDKSNIDEWKSVY